MEQPVTPKLKQRFLHELFIKTGIRAAPHQVGQQKNTLLDRCIRIAMPLGMRPTDEARILKLLGAFFKERNRRALEVASSHG